MGAETSMPLRPSIIIVSFDSGCSDAGIVGALLHAASNALAAKISPIAADTDFLMPQTFIRYALPWAHGGYNWIDVVKIALTLWPPMTIMGNPRHFNERSYPQ